VDPLQLLQEELDLDAVAERLERDCLLLEDHKRRLEDNQEWFEHLKESVAAWVLEQEQQLYKHDPRHYTPLAGLPPDILEKIHSLGLTHDSIHRAVATAVSDRPNTHAWATRAAVDNGSVEHTGAVNDT
jgi:hypothetical protein